jgi:hypothetical protein
MCEIDPVTRFGESASISENDAVIPNDRTNE